MTIKLQARSSFSVFLVLLNRAFFPYAKCSRAPTASLSRGARAWSAVSSSSRRRPTSTSWFGTRTASRWWRTRSSACPERTTESGGRGSSPRWRRRTAPWGWRRGTASWPNVARPHGMHHLSCDLLSINLSSVHVLQSALRILSLVILHIRKSPRKKIKPVHRQVYWLHVAVHAKYLEHVILGDVASKARPGKYNELINWNI